jgi:hypothetical protein
MSIPNQGSPAALLEIYLNSEVPDFPGFTAHCVPRTDLISFLIRRRAVAAEAKIIEC